MTASWHRRTATGAAVLSLALLLASACGSSPSSPSEPSPGAVFLIRACLGSEHAPDGELFRARILDRATIAEAERLVGAGEVKIIAGPLAAGDGGFNAPWSWHLDPAAVRFAENTIEVCDGCPSFIEADLQYWLETIGSYCPWSTEVISRQS